VDERKTRSCQGIAQPEGGIQTRQAVVFRALKEEMKVAMTDVVMGKVERLERHLAGIGKFRTQEEARIFAQELAGPELEQ
jgi:hypothetical protein